MNKVWKEFPLNSVLQGKGFYVSYNPSTSGKFNEGLTELATILGSKGLKNGEETALVQEGMANTFYILTGDFREEYEQLIDEGFDACLEFFRSMKSEFGNSWSTNEEDKL